MNLDVILICETFVCIFITCCLHRFLLCRRFGGIPVKFFLQFRSEMNLHRAEVLMTMNVKAEVPIPHHFGDFF